MTGVGFSQNTIGTKKHNQKGITHKKVSSV